MLSSQCLLVSTVFGTVSSLHPTSFLMTCFTNFFILACSARGDDITGTRTYVVRASVLRTYAHAYCFCFFYTRNSSIIKTKTNIGIIHNSCTKE